MAPSRSPDSGLAARGPQLLGLARSALETMDGSPDSSQVPWTEWLAQPGASFVTLRQNGRLRGCIGSLAAYRALGQDVHDNARAAARRDPRFHPLPVAELPSVQVSVSVLTRPRPLQLVDRQALLEALEPHRDGLIVDFNGQRATFLPSVWKTLAEPETFIDQLWRKAGLEVGFWHPDLQLARYTTLEFSEPG